jgi:autotransporter-associated beta strand protein
MKARNSRLILSAALIVLPILTSNTWAATWTQIASGNASGTWGTSSNWTPATVPNATDAVADFSTLDLTVNSTITVSAPVTVGSMIFGDINPSNDWTVSGSAITLATSSGTPTITGKNGRTVTLSTPLAGTQGLTKNGNWALSTATSLSGGLSNTSVGGNLTLSANNTYTGATTVSVGTLQVSGAAGALSGTTGLTVNGNAQLINGDSTTANNNGVNNRINSAATLTLGGTGGAGTFTMGVGTTGTNAQTLTSLAVNAGANTINNNAGTTAAQSTLTFSGAAGSVYTRATNGLVNLVSGFTPATQSVTTTNSSNSVLFGSTANVVVGQAISGANITAGSFVASIVDATHVTITQNVSATGGTTGAATYFSSTNPQQIAFTNAPTGASVSGTGGNEILVGAILGGNDFVKAASSNLTAASYTASGATTLTAGANINLITQNTTLGNNSTLSINSLRFSDNAARTLNLGTGSALTIASGGILTASTVATTGSSITGGSITSGQSDLIIFANGTGNNNPRNANSVLNVGSQITGSISLTVGGVSGGAPGALAQQITLGNATNNYTGGTFLTNGSIIISSDANLGAVTGAVTAVSGVNSISPTGSFTFNASRNFVVNSGALLNIGDQGGTTTIAGTLSGGGIFGVGYVSNAQRVILTGNNSGFTGTYTVNGYLRADEGVGLSSTANLVLAGRNNGGPTFTTLGTLETKGTFSRSLGAGAGQVQWSTPNSQYSDGGFAAVGGALTVNLGGAGATLTQGVGGFLTGNSIFTLQNTASTDVLTFSNAINNNGVTLNVQQGAGTATSATNATLTGVISGSGGFTKAVNSNTAANPSVNGGIGLMTLSGNNTYTGKTSIQGGTLSVASLNKLVGGTANSNLGAPITVANGTINFGSTTLAGTLLYTGSGETTDRAIQVGSNAATPAPTDTGGATLQNDGSGALTFSAATFNSANTGVIATTARILTLQGSNTGDNTISGIIQNNTVGVSGTGNVALTKAGLGTWVLAGANTYSGATTISAGTLKVGNATALGNAGAVSVTSGAALDLNGTTMTGTNTLTLNGTGITNGGALTNSSATAATYAGLVSLGSTSLINATGGNITVSNTVTGTGSLTKNGAGTLTLTGTNTYTGQTIVSGGTLVLTGNNTLGTGTLSPDILIGSSSTPATLTLSGSGILSIPGSTVSSYNVVSVGNAANSRGVLNIQGSSQLNLLKVTGATNYAGALVVGNGGSSSAGTVNQSGGTVTLDQSLFLGTNGTGYYGLSGGTLTLTAAAVNNATRFRIASPVTGNFGVFQMTGGTLNMSGMVGLGLGIVDSPVATLGATDAQLGYGSFYATGGSFTTAVYNTINIANSGGQGDLTVGGSASINIATNGVYLGNIVANGVGILNLDGGTLQAGSISTTVGGGTSYVNFNGGTLKANNATGTFLAGLTRANVNGAYSSGGISYAGGAAIDTNGQNITIGQALLAPTGSGVATSGSFTPITGLIGAPYVLVSGTGTGATAQAIFDAGTGTVTGITVTNPGIGYSGTPTFNLTGGGLSGTTTINGTTVANTSGGLTKSGTGTLTLTGTNTYTGDTTVSAGTLAVNGTSIADGGKLVITGSGKVNVTGTEVVNSLYFGATQQSLGTWGSTSSSATHKDDTRFSGTGVLSVTTGAASGYNTWATFYGLQNPWLNVNPALNGTPTADPDGDGLTNLQEFAFGTNPTVSSTGSIAYVAGGAVTTPGSPVAVNVAVGGGVDYRAVFGRRKSYVADGLTYTVQFSVDFSSWTNSADAPTVLTGSGSANPSEIEAVSVPYPLVIPYTRDGIPGFEKPTFFRVGVTSSF